PVVIDPALFAGAEPSAVMSFGSAPLADEMLTIARQTLFRPKAGGAADRSSAAFEQVVGALAGPWATADRPTGGPKAATGRDMI
ncbi:hypothetical protein, partial [Salmonella sp. SAL4435]|uniref:hypothetical protein n=1 Tax=Salmonella sp. SAL4435 TaxID=3159890 RepID=UPI00397D3872